MSEEVARIVDAQFARRDAEIARLRERLMVAHEQIGELKWKLANGEKNR